MDYPKGAPSGINEGVKPNEIAILAKQWDQLSEIRALLEREAGIPTYALKGQDVKLIRHSVTDQLLKQLQVHPTLTLEPNESVRQRFQSFFERKGRRLSEPTIKILLKIADDPLIKNVALALKTWQPPLPAEEIATSIYEFKREPE